MKQNREIQGLQLISPNLIKKSMNLRILLDFTVFIDSFIFHSKDLVGLKSITLKL